MEAERVCFENQPRFFEFLSPADMEEYKALRETLATKCEPKGIMRVLSLIREFCIKGDGKEWTRYLVCGVCWLPNGDLAMNVRNFRVLCPFTKSCLNSAMQKAGYVTVPHRNCHLVNIIPFLEDHEVLLREWVIKALSPVTPQPVIPELEGIRHKEAVQACSPMPESASFGPLTLKELRKVDEKKMRDEWFDDPFCLPPAFLLEDTSNFVACE